MRHYATVTVELPYACACGFRGGAMIRTTSPTTTRTREDAERTAHEAARDILAMARCPSCGSRDEELRARVRRRALTASAGLGTLTFATSVGLLFLRTMQLGVGSLVTAAALTAFALTLGYWNFWLRVAAAADEVEIDPAVSSATR